MNNKEFMNAISITGLGQAIGFAPSLVPSDEDISEKKEDDIREINTCCRACIANCGVIATVKNGRVVKLRGNPADKMSKGRMCAKGLSGINALYHPNRNKYPMKRVGERGSGKWKRISWEQALGEIADKLIEIKREYGAESVFCSTGGGGNPEIWSIARFCNIFGTPNWFEPGCAQCYLPRVLGYTMMYGGVDPSIADSNALELYFDSEIKTLVMWGTDPSYSCPASGGGAVNDQRAAGVKTVVIDPRLTPDAAKADVWLPIRPGSDVALQLAWIKYIIDHDLYDREFVMKWTNLPYLVNVETKMQPRAKVSDDPDIPDTFYIWDANTDSMQPMEYPWDDALSPVLEGCFEADGVIYKTGFTLLREQVEEYTLEKAAEICWLDRDTIEEAILLYAENTPSAIAIGVATDQSANSVQAAMAACTLDCIMGNVERPGALMQRFRTSGTFDMPNYPVPICADLLPDEQLKKRLGGNEYKGLGIWFAGHPSSILEAILTEKPYPMKMWIDRSGNKLGAVANSKKWRKAIDKLDMIVHIYMYPTSFSAYADILLPSEEWLETDMMVETCNTLCARQQCVHLWETVDETVIWSLIARACAERGDPECQRAFDAEFMGNNLPYWDKVTDLFDHFLSRIDLTFDKLRDITPYEYMTREQWQTYYVYKWIDEKTGKPGGFPTPSKKLEVYLESMITLSRTGRPFSKCDLPPASKDYSPLPYYLEPAESPLRDNENSKKFPLVYTGGRVPYYHHNTLRNIPFLREMYPAPEIWVNPVTAAGYEIESGDWLWMSSERGEIRGIANVTEGIPPGVVYMERFWNPENLNKESHGWTEMNVNVLTRSDAPFNDVVGTWTLRGFQVQLRKADGPPEGVWLDPEDFRPWLPSPSDPTKEVHK